MCLKISNEAENTESKQKLIKTNSEKGLLFGYKHFCRINPYITSTYMSNHFWDTKRGWVNSNRKCRDISVNECYYREINDGFHIFLTKKDALNDLQEYCGGAGGDLHITARAHFFVRKVWFKPEHLVAVGEFLDIPSAVVTKLYVRFD